MSSGVPAGTNIHPRDWMLIQRLNARLRCLEVAAELGGTPAQQMERAEDYFE